MATSFKRFLWLQLKWVFIHSSSGTLAHYNLPGPEPGSQGEFMVNKNVTFFNKVRDSIGEDSIG